MSAHDAFEAKLDQLLSIHINPLVDGICSIFLTPEELEMVRDRTARIKIVFKKLNDPTLVSSPTIISLRRLLRSSFMYIRHNSNLLRHYVPVPHKGAEPLLLGQRGRPLKIDYTCALERFIDFNFCLFALMEQETDPDYKFVYQCLA